jgi:ASC-1-like (ASCH) protein
MTARFTDVRQGFDIGEGLDVNINNIEKALRDVNIPIRDSANSFRDMQDVITDLSKGWDTYGETQRAAIIKQFAGIRQKEDFIVLMQSELEVQKALEIQRKASEEDLSQKRYEIYLKGVEAAMNNLRSSWEKLVMSSASGELLSDIYNAGAKILDVVDAIGGLVTILKVAIPLVILFNAAWIKTNITLGATAVWGLIRGLAGLIPILWGATSATNGLTVALGAANVAALPFVGALLLIGGLTYVAIAGGKEYNKTLQDTKASLIDVKNELMNSASSYEEYMRQMKKAASGTGVQYEKDTGKAFRASGRGVKVYIAELDLLTEAQWKARDSAVALDKGEKDDIAALKKLSAVAKEAAKSFEELKNEAFTTLLADESFNKIIDDTITLLKQQANIKKESLQLELKNLKDSNDKYKETYKLQIDSIKNISVEKKKAIEDEINAQNQLYDSQKNAIEEQLKAYKAIIDEQKISLQLKKEETDFNNARAEKEKVLSDLINQIAILRLDTSQSATAQRMTLEEEASKLTQELSQSDADRAYQLQIESLDAEQQNAEDTANIQLSALEETKKNYEIEAGLRQNALDDEQTKAEQRYEIITKGLDDTYNAKEIALQNQIAQVDDYLSKEGLLRKEAIDRIISDNGTLYAQLAEWNRVYGTGIETDIRSKWDSAIVSLNTYKDILESISRIGIPQGAFPSGDPSQNSEYVDVYNGRNNPNVLYAGRHSGVKSGFVGNQPKLKSNEEFAKLLDGELVVNSKQMDTFMKNLSPATMNSNPSSSSSNFAGGVSMGNLMNIVVTGSLDKTILPSIKNIADQVLDELNKAVLIRGSNRTANLFGN